MEEDISIVIRRCKRSKEIKLDLSNRDLTSMPNSLLNLTHLQELDLSNNNFQILSTQICKLSNLKTIDLSNNKLSALPLQITYLNQLNELYLMGNPLFGKFQQLLKSQNCKGSKLIQILNECFINNGSEEIDDFELNDDDFNFGDTPSPQRIEKQPKIIQISPKQKEEVEEELEEDLLWMNSFVEEPDSKKFNNTMYKDNRQSDQQTIKRQKQKIRELEKELFEIKKTPKNIKKQPSISDNEAHQILEVDYEELKFGKKISQGGFSILYKGLFRGTTVAIKKIFNPVITQELIAEFNNEIRILNQHRHPNFIMLMAIVNKPPNLCIITDFVTNGSLFDQIHKIKFKNEQLLRFSQETARAILYLHSANIVHRDIKTLNVLLDKKFTIKLCDFGLARHIVNFVLTSDLIFQSILNKGSKTYVGTPNYMAPEIFNQRQLTEKIDVFAFGTMVWELFARQVPYDGLDPPDIMKKLQKEESLPDENVPSKIMKVINSCRTFKPEKRPSFNQIYGYFQKLIPKDVY